MNRYWGKRDVSLNLPTNSSLSVTLSQDNLRTLTTASCSASYSAPDTLTLNDEPSSLTSSRPAACLRELRSLRAKLESSDSSLPPLSTYPLRIVSSNNFPTAAGLASSAAGFAALVRAIADLYQLPQSPTELSLIARQGSGSACRSLMGGYVAWDMGKAGDGSDSMARVVAEREHWPEMRALILVVSAAKKGTPSTTGMQATVSTSQLFQRRADVVVPEAMAAMEKAIQEKDFEAFGKVTMRDSNSFHACCMDTTPPIFYMNDVSRAAVRAVDSLNDKAGKVIAAYTFDAGPNAVIYHLEKDEATVVGAFKALLQDKSGWEGAKAQSIQATGGALPFDDKTSQSLKEGVSSIILTSIGGSPVKVDTHLVSETGEKLKA